MIFPKTTQRRDHTSLLLIAVGVVCMLLRLLLLLLLLLLLWWLVVGLGVLPVPGAVVEGGVEVHCARVRGGKPGDLLEHVLSGRGSARAKLIDSLAEGDQIWQKVSLDF